MLGLIKNLLTKGKEQRTEEQLREGDLSELEIKLVALSTGSFARYQEIVEWASETNCELNEVYDNQLDNGTIEEILGTLEAITKRYEEAQSKTPDTVDQLIESQQKDQSWQTPHYKEIFGFIDLIQPNTYEMATLARTLLWMLADIHRAETNQFEEEGNHKQARIWGQDEQLIRDAFSSLDRVTLHYSED